VIGNFFSRLYRPKRDDAGPSPSCAVQFGLDFSVGLAGVVDPPGLIDHVEIEPVVDPEAVPIVGKLLLLIEDPFDVGDDLAGLKSVDGANAITVDGRAKNTKTGGVGHGAT
jgi:hypothetical protein